MQLKEKKMQRSLPLTFGHLFYDVCKEPLLPFFFLELAVCKCYMNCFIDIKGHNHSSYLACSSCSHQKSSKLQ